MSGERISEIGGFWLSIRDRSPFYQITWFDNSTRQTRRLSTGSTDLRDAEIALAAHVTKNAAPANELPAEMPLATVLHRYYETRGRSLASADTVKHAIKVWLDFWKTGVVSDMTRAEQERFSAHMRAMGFKGSYISRVIGVGKAALRMAWDRGEVTSIPKIIDARDYSDEDPAPDLSKKEMGALLGTALIQKPHIFTFMLISICTLSRPDAVLDLGPDQVDFTSRLIDLNPKGRRRTKKGRPIVPLCDALAAVLEPLDVRQTYVQWAGKPIGQIDLAWKSVRAAAGVNPKATPYSIRHTMAIELRRRGVPAWEVEGMLGHKMPGVTERYAKYAPDYRDASRQAIDAYIRELRVTPALHMTAKSVIKQAVMA